MLNHTVEKIGGTSMSKFNILLKNIFLNKKNPYNRVFVVSAYNNVTNQLLEHKKNKQDGIYQSFIKGKKNIWRKQIQELEKFLLQINKKFEPIGLDFVKAEKFVKERIEGIVSCLDDLESLFSYGHFHNKENLVSIRELLSSLGEAHSAFNTACILKSHGINARFLDLTAWKNGKNYKFVEMIKKSFHGIDFSKELIICPGYTKCSEGLMNTFDRGYSEITFAKIATTTKAKEGIIHKEFHLCTADPKLVGEQKVKIIGNTNFDVADQLADLEMEAIHPKAAKEIQQHKIPLRIINCFEPTNKGTLITEDFVSDNHKVDIICGRNNIQAIEVCDSDMIGIFGYDYRLTEILVKNRVSYIAKNTNANTITHYISDNTEINKKLIKDIKENFPSAKIFPQSVAIVSCIGSNMHYPNFLASASTSLAKNKINILAISQCMRQVNIQFVIERKNFKKAIKALHYNLIENPMIKP